MTRFKVTICLVLVTLINSTVAENAQVEPSGSVFSSLLQSLSSSDRSPNCPGRCFNAIAALACQETLDTPGLCRKTGYRCCKNVAEKESSDVQIVTTAATSESPVTKEETQIPKDKEAENEKGETGEPSITKGIKTLRYSDDGTKEETDKKGEDNNQTIKKDEEIVEKMDEDEIVPQLYSSSAHSVEVCPGVCVAQRISNFCEAVIDVQGLCKPQLRCCVPAKLFDGVDIPPKEFKVLNAAESSNVTLEESRSEMTDLPKFETSVTTPSTTPKETTTEKKRTPVIEKKEIKNMDKVPLMEEDDGIPPEKRCTGTCIAGFFAFLCDSIDRNRECAGGGKCCIAPRKTKPGKNDKKEVIVEQPSEQSPPRSTTKKPKVQTTTRPTTPKPKTTTTERETTMEEPPPPCSGSCLSVEIASQCQHPSRLVASTGCSSDEICCEGKGKSPVKSPVKSSVSQVPEAFGTLLSLFGGGQPEKRPPPPPRRTSHPVTITTTAPTTTTPPTTAIPVTERPECTGTCISPILSFTCFGNAEMSDLFKCSKDKQSCCATKSAIRDLTRQHEIRNNARNDTVFPSVDPYYPLPSTVVRPPHSYTSEDDYHNPFYNFPSQEHVPFKPPPPPPSYQSSIYAQQSFDKPHKEHNIYTPYGQPHPVPPPQPPQPPMNPHTHSNAYIKPPHSNPIPPPPSTHGGQPQPHYNHDVNDRQPYLPTQATISQDAASSSSSQVHFLGGSPHVDNKYVCGVKGTNRVARVVGGEDAVPGEWCWQVALINSLNQYLCGGALIGTQWVLTAAHCVTNIVRSGDAIYVRVGDHDLTTRFGSPGAQTLPVATTYIHHNHNSQTLDNDIALLKLSSHAELGNGVCLACLPARGVSQVAGKRCTVTGYGYMGETGPIPLRVREAEIPVVSDNECVRKINAVTEKIFILPASSFCAGGESGHDACQGDGGGPLVCNVDGYFELSGLVSWGFGCGRQDVPGVYVKVSSFIGWVNQIISVNNL